MAETLCSVGLDVGTTSTQMVVSDLEIENQASGFAVPEMVIRDRKIRYRSPVHFTPLLDGDHMDAQALRKLVEEEYRKAGITRQQVQTGAIIITGETSRKENARAVLSALSHLAGDFVVATAGPDLESRLAAKGSGAVDISRETGKTLLHMDIGGGTSNLALIREGEILDTGCINVGGRLLQFSHDGTVEAVSPVMKQLTDLVPGNCISEKTARELAARLTEVLEMAAGLRPRESILDGMTTKEGKLLQPGLLEKKPVISFSGGVADCIDQAKDWREYGDLGPLLGRAIRRSRLCSGEYLLGRETIRATVIGAGCHTTQLSGSTVFYRNIRFPLQNIPAVRISSAGEKMAEAVKKALSGDDPVILALSGVASPDYGTITELADKIAEGVGNQGILLCLEQDMAKALGQALALRLPPNTPILCIDRIRPGENGYLDVGAPVGPAIPVVVKTLILGNRRME